MLSFQSLHHAPFPQYNLDQFYTQSPNLTALLTSTLANQKPLLIIGPTQCGKTHLAHAIAHHAQQHEQAHLLTSAACIMKMYRRAVHHDATYELNDHLTHYKLIIIDDAHQLQRSQHTQALMINILNGPIAWVMTAPSLQHICLDTRLQDRIKNATTLRLPAHNHTTLCQYYALGSHATIPAHDLTNLSTADIDLDTKKAILSQHARKGTSITQALQLLKTQKPAQRYLPQHIISAMSATQNISHHDLCQTRPKNHCRALQDLCIFLCHQQGVSLLNLCETFQKKHYVSIHQACRRTHALLAHKPEMIKVIHALEKHLHSHSA